MQGVLPINVSVYSRPRVFQERFFKISETVGLQSVVWAFVFGPLFYWKKGAKAEAVLMLLVTAPLLHMHFAGSNLRVSLSAIPYVSALLWAAFAALAPILLAMHYRRRGWVEMR